MRISQQHTATNHAGGWRADGKHELRQTVLVFAEMMDEGEEVDDDESFVKEVSG